jgi:predicted transcriptional regulator
MTTQTVTLRLPDDVYRRMQQMANVTKQPLEDVVYQSIQGNLPPSVDDILPEWQKELSQLQGMDAQALLRLAKESMPAKQWERHERLLFKNQSGELSDREREELAELRQAADTFVLRRSYALALLKWRGYSLPPASDVIPNDSTP